MHTHVFGEEGQAWLAGSGPASCEEEGGVGDRRLTGGLELCLAGVNMESMEYGERNTEVLYSCRGEPCR